MEFQSRRRNFSFSSSVNLFILLFYLECLHFEAMLQRQLFRRSCAISKTLVKFRSDRPYRPCFNSFNAKQISKNLSMAVMTAEKSDMEQNGRFCSMSSGKNRKNNDKIKVETHADMISLLQSGTSHFDLDVRGNSYSQLVERSESNIHPVLSVLQKRALERTKPGQRTDGFKVGLAIEGGGMRGCVSAGMVASLMGLGLMDSVDAVYGSSAGSLVGAYAIAGQEGMPRLGCSVYYDTLTGAGRDFIDTRYLARAMGMGLLATPLTRRAGFKDLIMDKLGAPVLKLDYLLGDVVGKLRPLDWNLFWSKQRLQPMNIVASGVVSQSSIVLSSAGGHFDTLEGLTACMRASMLLPGITGPMVRLPKVNEPLVDSQLYEPIPYRAALKDGCTHVIVLRSRPDGCSIIGKPKLPERMIARRYFTRKHDMPNMYTYMKIGGHKIVYAQDILNLNSAALATEGDDGPYLLPLSLPIGESEISRLERRREQIFNGVRQGCQYGHNILRSCALPNNPLRMMDGSQASQVMFPDNILDYNVDPILSDLPGFDHIDVHRISKQAH